MWQLPGGYQVLHLRQTSFGLRTAEGEHRGCFVERFQVQVRHRLRRDPKLRRDEPPRHDQRPDWDSPQLQPQPGSHVKGPGWDIPRLPVTFKASINTAIRVRSVNRLQGCLTLCLGSPYYRTIVLTLAARKIKIYLGDNFPNKIKTKKKTKIWILLVFGILLTRFFVIFQKNFFKKRQGFHNYWANLCLIIINREGLVLRMGPLMSGPRGGTGPWGQYTRILIKFKIIFQNTP